MIDSEPQQLVIVPVPAFKDNYIWLMVRGRSAAIVDPGDAAPIEAALSKLDLSLDAILLTHHHPDNMGGVAALVARRESATLPVYGPRSEAIAGVTHPLDDGDRIALPTVGLDLTVLAIPGHTRGHIAYFCDRRDAAHAVAASSIDTPALLFCGDTLFACGCGRLFEGTPSQMHASLTRLAALPVATHVYCGHEYTLANIRFARAVEPDNAALAEREASAIATRARSQPTLPSTIALERETNPFLRCDVSAVRLAAQKMTSAAAATDIATFAALRKWKDAF